MPHKTVPRKNCLAQQHNPSAKRKSWLTRGAPRSSLSSEDAAAEDASRTRQIAKELKRGFSAPEVLNPPNAQPRSALVDLVGKHSAEYFSRLPPGLVAARGAVVIAATNGAAELRRCETARSAAQKTVPPVVTNAPLAKKPRLSLSPSAARPLRVDNGEKAMSPGGGIRIPRSAPAPAHVSEPEKNEEQWYKATVAALLDEDLSDSVLGPVLADARTLTVGKLDPNISSALILPLESVAFKRAPFRHSRDFVKHFPVAAVSKPTGKAGASADVVNLDGSPSQKLTDASSPVGPSSIVALTPPQGKTFVTGSEAVNGVETNGKPMNGVGGAAGPSMDDDDVYMQDMELGFTIRKGAPPSNLQMFLVDMHTVSKTVEVAKGTVAKTPEKTKTTPSRSGPKKTMIAAKLQQRKKSLEKKLHNAASAATRRKTLARPVPMEIARRNAAKLEGTIAQTRPRRQSAGNGKRIITVDRSDSSSESSSEEDASSSAVTPKPAPPRRRSETNALNAARRLAAQKQKGKDTGGGMDKSKLTNGRKKIDSLKIEMNSPVVEPQEILATDRTKDESQLFSHGYQCIKFSEMFTAAGNAELEKSTVGVGPLEGIADPPYNNINIVKTLILFDKRKKTSSVFSLPDSIDEEAEMIHRYSKQFDTFSEEDAFMPRIANDSFASMFVTQRATAGKAVPAASSSAVKMEALSDEDESPEGAEGSTMALEDQDENALGSEDDTPEEKALDLMRRVCGDMIGEMTAEDKGKVLKWAKRDFSLFEEGDEIMELTLRVTETECDRCQPVPEGAGPCEASIVLKLWRDMTWRKVRRLRHVLGNEA